MILVLAVLLLGGCVTLSNPPTRKSNEDNPVSVWKHNFEKNRR